MNNDNLKMKLRVLELNIGQADKAPMMKKAGFVMSVVKEAYAIIAELVAREVARNDGEK